MHTKGKVRETMQRDGATVYVLVDNPKQRLGFPDKINLFSAHISRDNGLLNENEAMYRAARIQALWNIADELNLATEDIGLIKDAFDALRGFLRDHADMTDAIHGQGPGGCGCDVCERANEILTRLKGE